ncbi:MAG: DUF1616 domain-containing protein [Bacillota bacterium]
MRGYPYIMKLAIRNEFAVIGALSLLLAFIITAADIHALRVALGLPFVLFFPGYTLIAALFPGRDSAKGTGLLATASQAGSKASRQSELTTLTELG